MLTLLFIKQSYFDMTLLIILGLVFAGVALMVIVGEKFGKPMEAEEQAKLGKFSRILMIVLVIAVILNAVI